MRLERTETSDRRNLRNAGEFVVALNASEAAYYMDVCRLIEMRCTASIDVFGDYDEVTLHITCDLDEIKTMKAAYKVAKKHIQIQRKAKRGPMIVGA